MNKTTQKSAFNKSVWIIMRASLILAICFSTSLSLLAIEGKSQAIKDTPVVLSKSDITLEQVFNTIEKQSGYTFSYASNVRHLVVDNAVTKITNLGSLLEYLAQKHSLQFEPFDQMIAVNLLTKQRSGKIAGRVTDQAGNALAGATVKIIELDRTLVADNDGRFELVVRPGTYTIEVGYLAFATQRRNIPRVEATATTTANFQLVPSSDELSEVVVTALGLKREERSLGYAVGKIGGDELSRTNNENVLTGIAGKIPGVSISSTGGTGSSINMVIRGATSLTDNQPLFVVDGVPIINSINNISEIGSDNRVDYGNAIASINPENIAEISILKGASASALYGSRAANGVVMITTKSGKGMEKLSIDVGSNTVFDVPYQFLDMHSRFASGVLPFTPDNPLTGGKLVIEEGSAAGVGPELDKGYLAVQWNSPLDENGNPIPIPLVSHPNNVRNFVQTGITTTNSIAVANSNQRMDYRVAYANMSNRGIIPNSDLFRNSININSSVNLFQNLTLGTQVDISRNNSNNRPATNRGANPMEWAYKVSPHINILDLQNYWVPGSEGVQQLSADPREYNNPYFLAYEVNNAFVRDRVFGNAKLDWKITSDINLMARYALDMYHEERESKVPFSYTNEPRGAYGIIGMRQQEQNIDFLATYRKSLSDFTLSASAGGNIRYYQSRTTQAQSTQGAGLITPGLYTLGNISPAGLTYGSSIAEKAVNSIYGFANLGYKDMVYLDLTARNDWSSTLPAENRSYFYPSTSVSLLLDRILHMPKSVNLLKLRGGIAQVGNDTAPYSLYNTLGNAGAWGGNVIRLTKSGSLLTPTLKPEKSTAYELGIESAAWGNRLRLEANYYHIDNENQIIPTSLPSSSGYNSVNINAGKLSSKGYELVLGGVPIKTTDWMWDISVNWSRNRTTIKSLTEGMEFYSFWTEGRGGARTYVGEEIGDLYDSKLVVVEDPSSPYYGYPILDENGSWQEIRINNTRNKIGNFNPDFLLGAQTTLSYKNFTLSAALDMRFGGDFMSQTYRYSESNLRTQRFLDNLINPGGMAGAELREYLINNDLVRVDGNKFRIVGGPTPEMGGYPLVIDGVNYGDFAVFNPGVIAQYDADGNITGYTENLGEEGTKYLPYADNYPWDYMAASTFDASYIKLRELSVGYKLPGAWIKRLAMQNASVSLYTRNLILWTKAKIGVDPEQAFQQEAGTQGGGIQFKQGIERYNVTPWSMPIGVRLAVTF
ncbi:SusC/RagA family TonB-linked outer membrane protein [Sphingobacterium haloxyli]|nr:SusC/RagA family TonB-linked outer membrane protein [Sphingobacterium haloxyli]